MTTKSPCTGICTFDSKNGFCKGCLRTLDEARCWKKLSNYQRHKIINDCARREKSLRRNNYFRTQETT